MSCHDCEFNERGNSEEPCIDCSVNEVNRSNPEIDADKLPFRWEPLHKPHVARCPICGHPDYLPSGCCHWYVIRGIEKERDDARAQLARQTAIIEAQAAVIVALEKKHTAEISRCNIEWKNPNSWEPGPTKVREDFAAAVVKLDATRARLEELQRGNP